MLSISTFASLMHPRPVFKASGDGIRMPMLFLSFDATVQLMLFSVVAAAPLLFIYSY